MECKNCGHPLNGTENFCGNCGTKIDRAANQASDMPCTKNEGESNEETKQCAKGGGSLTEEITAKLKVTAKNMAKSVQENVEHAKKVVESGELQKNVREKFNDAKEKAEGVINSENVAAMANKVKSETKRLLNNAEEKLTQGVFKTKTNVIMGISIIAAICLLLFIFVGYKGSTDVSHLADDEMYVIALPQAKFFAETQALDYVFTLPDNYMTLQESLGKKVKISQKVKSAIVGYSFIILDYEKALRVGDQSEIQYILNTAKCPNVEEFYTLVFSKIRKELTLLDEKYASTSNEDIRKLVDKVEKLLMQTNFAIYWKNRGLLD